MQYKFLPKSNIVSKSVKVYFLEPILQKAYTAGYNRYLGIVKMVGLNFSYEILVIEPLKFRKNRFIRGIELRYKYCQILLRTKYNKNELKVLYLFGTNPALSLFFMIISRIIGFRLICEINEFPLAEIENNKIKKAINRIFIYPWHIKIFDGYSLITDELITFYRKYAKKRFLTKLPVTVDFDRFHSNINSRIKKYVFYAGSLDQKKDGIFFLLEAFRIISEKIDDLMLYIVYNEKSNLCLIQDYIRKNSIENKVKLIGFVNRDHLPQLICEALICVLPRPDSIQARGGFPTKLGEYLASGVPVIATRVGEIPNYLNENNAYLISTENIKEELVETILKILSNYGNAIQKGVKGRNVALSKFSLERNADVVKELIMSVVFGY